LLLYYISDRSQFPGSEAERREKLLANIAGAIRCGVDYIQLREKDLSARELEDLTRRTMQLRAENRLLETEVSGLGTTKLAKTRVLVNSRTDIAIAAGADGVHLRSGDIAPANVRAVASRAGGERVIIAVSCHTLAEVQAAADAGADFVVFGPVFGKNEGEGTGLEELHESAQIGIPVLALGGVTVQNAAFCMAAGAAGIAGIRLFQSDFVAKTVHCLRSLRA
jgi:thiamine-phosphate pyrophosphorylase